MSLNAAHTARRPARADALSKGAALRRAVPALHTPAPAPAPAPAPTLALPEGLTWVNVEGLEFIQARDPAALDALPAWVESMKGRFQARLDRAQARVEAARKSYFLARLYEVGGDEEDELRDEWDAACRAHWALEDGGHDRFSYQLELVEAARAEGRVAIGWVQA